MKPFIARLLKGACGFVVFVWLSTGLSWALDTRAEQALLLDATTGMVLFEKQADAQVYPSSMTKMMTIYMLFDALKAGRISLDDTFEVSKKAWQMGGSKMFVEVGKRVKIEDLIHGIIVQSGNDASIVVAEGLAGTEEAFAQLMNRKAAELGMTSTHFRNASGWPDPEHVTTVRDLARLAYRTIADFPEYYDYYAHEEFTFSGIRQRNRNPLLNKDLGVDGLKTGHTEAAGYGLTASAVQAGRRLILVVNGLASMSERASESERLMRAGFRDFDNYALFRAGETLLEAPVWLGTPASIPIVVENPVVLSLSRQARADMKVVVSYSEPLSLPIRKGQQVATLRVSIPGQAPFEYAGVAGADSMPLGFFDRFWAALSYVIWGSAEGS